eukprot:scaffold11427_cov231-Skeletonema_marinoi.AAC.3
MCSYGIVIVFSLELKARDPPLCLLHHKFRGMHQICPQHNYTMTMNIPSTRLKDALEACDAMLGQARRYLSS